MLKFSTYDVFADRGFAGNPLAIVEGADALGTSQMQTIAREFNLSETIFVQTPDDPAHTAKVRIFFPTDEIPFAGHPTIGCAIHLATTARPEGDFETLITLEERAGLVPVTVIRAGSAITAEFTAPKQPVALPGKAEPAQIAAALDLPEDAIGPHKPGIWQAGPAFIYAPVADLDALARARPVEPHWSQMVAAAGLDSVYLYTGIGQDSYQARMFDPGAGIPEDPATGSASAILAAQLLANGALGDGTMVTHLSQGIEMGRPSQIRLTTEISRGKITAIRVAGSAVPISSGRIRCP
ncbi:PhzF family phenazine biosynthesis protein [Rhodophyticola sp. CCM32]|uniref:PhzF family phenazine biosynthesis protein n=1 Tax=Rhodophyticola sp. CCM32 TaxID=2916397 RepID=UPI00107F0518|nr:PhzF family phenazine biosynthesis protein [Rhodophyticola sp. CCM32]QBX99591.1 PhzF family phenazine biosynthesis protein [Rhodophyticola sp. CCM32]